MPRKVYIIQMHTKSVPSRFVKLVTQYEYSHVGISLTKDCREIYSFGRKSLRNFLNGGFVKECRDGPFFQKFSDTVCRVYELEISENQYNKLEKRLVFMENHSELYKYDFFGAILRTLRIQVAFQNKYVCSTFVASVLHQSGVCCFEKQLCFIKPADFENLQGAQEVFSGDYQTLATAFCVHSLKGS